MSLDPKNMYKLILQRDGITVATAFTSLNVFSRPEVMKVYVDQLVDAYETERHRKEVISLREQILRDKIAAWSL